MVLNDAIELGKIGFISKPIFVAVQSRIRHLAWRGNAKSFRVNIHTSQKGYCAPRVLTVTLSAVRVQTMVEATKALTGGVTTLPKREAGCRITYIARTGSSGGTYIRTFNSFMRIFASVSLALTAFTFALAVSRSAAS